MTCFTNYQTKTFWRFPPWLEAEWTLPVCQRILNTQILLITASGNRRRRHPPTGTEPCVCVFCVFVSTPSEEPWLPVTLDPLPTQLPVASLKPYPYLRRKSTPATVYTGFRDVIFQHFIYFTRRLTIFPPPSRSLSLSRSLPPPWLLRSCWASWIAWVTTSPSPRKPEAKNHRTHMRKRTKMRLRDVFFYNFFFHNSVIFSE